LRPVLFCAFAVSLAGCSQPIDPGAGGFDTGIGTDTDPTNNTDPTNPSGDDAPIADAGDDVLGMVTDEIPLDGSGSYDPDGEDITFEWAFVTTPIGSGSTLINETREFASFFADKPGVYTVELVVRDGSSSASDIVEITVSEENETPIADSGPDQTAQVGDTVEMDGSDSFDPDGDEITFAWTLAAAPGASNAVLLGATNVNAEFEPDVAGTYILQLVVSDGFSTSAIDSAIVTATGGGGGGGTTTGGGGCLSCAAAQRSVAPGGVAVSLAPLALFVLRRRKTQV
jgi:PKD domain